MWPISPKVRNLQARPAVGAPLLDGQLRGGGWGVLRCVAPRGSTTGPSSRRRASGSMIRSSTSSSSSASTRRSGLFYEAKNRSATVGVQSDSQAPARAGRGPGSRGNLQSGPSSDPSSDPASVNPSVHHRSPRNSANAQAGWHEWPSVYRSDSLRCVYKYTPRPLVVHSHLVTRDPPEKKLPPSRRRPLMPSSERWTRHHDNLALPIELPRSVMAPPSTAASREEWDDSVARDEQVSCLSGQ